TIGPSALHWDEASGCLSFTLDERSAPWAQRVRGRLRVWPQTRCSERFELDARGRHRWRPWAPQARIEVAFDTPALRWQGTAYCDANDGDAPLASAFRSCH
ncbi:MAG: carotenoid 1,2-hydratase, partial [Burkholderiales bacterium]|nr:carotenoid 1,2-hydratase [Burkholderiales bacterium]